MSSLASMNQKKEYHFEYIATLNHIMERVWYVLRDAFIS